MLAIVLSRHDFREFDQMISFYTEERGKMSALARGVKKSTSKNTSALEPMSYVEVDIVEGKEVDHVTKVYLEEFFPQVRSDLTKISCGRYVVELLDTVLVEGTPDKALYDLLLSFLFCIEQAEQVRFLLLAAFAIKVWSRLGFTPVLDRCVRCGKVVTANEQYYFEVASGGLVDASCALTVRQQGGQLIALQHTLIALLSKVVTASWDEVNDLVAAPQEEKLLHDLLYYFVLYHGNQKIKDWRVMEKIIMSF